MSVINIVSDLIDEIAMCYYNSLVIENKRVSYLTCLTKTLNYLQDNDLLSKDNLLDEDIEKIIQLKNEVESIEINLEELRRAVFLLEIKAYKHSNMLLDQITPDGVGIIFTFLLDLEKESKRLLDVAGGTGNLLFVINNYAKNKWEMSTIEQNIDLWNYPWFPNQSQWGDFFLHGKMQLILGISIVAAVILLDTLLVKNEKIVFSKSLVFTNAKA